MVWWWLRRLLPPASTLPDLSERFPRSPVSLAVGSWVRLSRWFRACFCFGLRLPRLSTLAGCFPPLSSCAGLPASYGFAPSHYIGLNLGYCLRLRPACQSGGSALRLQSSCLPSRLLSFGYDSDPSDLLQVLDPSCLRQRVGGVGASIGGFVRLTSPDQSGGKCQISFDLY